ncbi:MAG: calcium-binding protein, partial [Verrucomicrobiaceae bacterium]
TGGSPTFTNTIRIDVLGGGGNDEIALYENLGPLPPARIFGEGGNDMITGGSGADFLDGGTGNDRLSGRGGMDNLTGGDGADILTGGDGDDQVSGGNQDDQFIWNPGDDDDLLEGDAGTDTINVVGQSTPESYLASVPASRVRFERNSTFPFVLDIGTIEHLVLNANAGDDTFSTTGNLAALIQITVYGGPGSDTLSGSNGPDILDGGDDIDQIDGQQGIDTILGGNGDDVIQWAPGDGSDFIEGQGGQDTLLFNASNASEIITVSPNGGRVSLFRDVANIVLDLNDVETLDLNLLGGTDTLTVNNLQGTDVTTVIADLAGTGGAGDAAADNVTLNGTSAPDIITVSSAPSQVTVTGLPATLRILQPEVANDDLTINGLGGNDTFGIGAGVAGLIGVTTNQ